jgi:hypothetical protein
VGEQRSCTQEPELTCFEKLSEYFAKELRQLQLTSHASSTLDVYQKIKVNKLSPQDGFLFLTFQLSLCMRTALVGRWANKILWEALLVKELVAERQKK